MARSGLHFSIFLVITLIITLFLLGNLYSFLQSPNGGYITGTITATSNVTLVQAGAAGISLPDTVIAFGSGFYNGTCFLDFAKVNSNTSQVCWVNTTAFPTQEDVHVVANTGTSVINVSVSPVNLTDAEQLFCNGQQNCTLTNDALINIAAAENETGSCIIGVNTTYQTIANNATNATVTLCQNMGFAINANSIKSYVEYHIPKDAQPGNKTLTLTYEAIAV